MSIDEAVKQVGQTAKAVASSSPAILFALVITAIALFLAYENTQVMNRALDALLVANKSQNEWVQQTVVSAIMENDLRANKLSERFVLLEREVHGLRERTDKLISLIQQRTKETPSPHTR